MDYNLEIICVEPPHGLNVYQVSAQSDVNCRRSYTETKEFTDERTDAKGYNIMRPFFKRAYKNDGVNERSKPYTESKLVHLIFDIHYNLFKLNKFWLNQIAIAMKFYRSKPEFHLKVSTTYRFNIEILSKLGGGRVERRCWVNFQCRGVLLLWMIVGQGPIALAIGAGGGLFGHFFSHLSFLFSFSLSLGDDPI